MQGHQLSKVQQKILAFLSKRAGAQFRDGKNLTEALSSEDLI